jgi:hypothetical protein
LDRRPIAGARHPLRPHSARSSSAGHRWPAAAHQLADPDHQQWPPHNAQIYAAGAERGIDAATAPNGSASAQANKPKIIPPPVRPRSARRTRDRADRDLQSICQGGAGFGTHNSWQPRNHALAALADSYRRPVPGPASGRLLTAHAKGAARYARKRTTAAPYR